MSVLADRMRPDDVKSRWRPAERTLVTRAKCASSTPAVRGRDAGFTLVEVIVVIVLMGVASTIAVGGFQSYARSAEHSGTRNDVVSALRAAHQRALAEAAVYCVRFAGDGKSWTTFRGSCASGTAIKGPEEVGGPHVSLTDVSFLRADGTAGSRDVEFTARGTASKGSLRITRSDSSKTYTVTVEGLTARVSSS
jgi:prepilin-type N-terminal cleavage/methylation domain-containing protein